MYRSLTRTIIALLLIAAAHAQDRLYVVQMLDESLASIRLSDGSVNSRVLELGYGCNDIVATGTRLYVTNSLLNTVQEIDAINSTTLRDIPTTGGVNPYSLCLLSPDTLAVTNWISDNVVLLRRSDGEVVRNVPVGVAPEGILAHGDCVYVCLTRYLSFGRYGPGAVMVYDRRTFALVDSISVGCNPQYAAVDDQNRLHVVCTGNYGDISGAVHVVSLGDLQIDTVLSVGGTPSNISLGGGFAFLAAGGWEGQGRVHRYRLSDLAMLNNDGSAILTGVGAYDVEAMPDGSFYVSCFGEDLIEHRSPSGALLGTYLVSDGPGQMAPWREPADAPQRNAVVSRAWRLVEAYPNPFNGFVRLRFSALAGEETYINVYSMLGGFVGRIRAGRGVQEVVWGGDGFGGSRLASGSYFVAADGSAVPTRVVLVR